MYRYRCYMEFRRDTYKYTRKLKYKYTHTHKNIYTYIYVCVCVRFLGVGVSETRTNGYNCIGITVVGSINTCPAEKRDSISKNSLLSNCIHLKLEML